MSATNKTTYYDLAMFIGTDTPSWLGDWNDTMTKLDAAVNNVNTKAQSAQSTANSAQSAVDANTEALNATNTELETLKKAVQNYDAILNFHEVAAAINPNNVKSRGGVYMVQNNNKTLNKIMVSVQLSALTNPTTYVYTQESGTSTWYDLFTVEDNALKLNQTSLPNYQNVLTIGVINDFSTDSATAGKFEGGMWLRAWFDGATTHFGFNTNRGATDLKNDILNGNFSVFTTGSVYNPDNPVDV